MSRRPPGEGLAVPQGIPLLEDFVSQVQRLSRLNRGDVNLHLVVSNIPQVTERGEPGCEEGARREEASQQPPVNRWIDWRCRPFETADSGVAQMKKDPVLAPAYRRSESRLVPATNETAGEGNKLKGIQPSGGFGYGGNLDPNRLSQPVAKMGTGGLCQVVEHCGQIAPE